MLNSRRKGVSIVPKEPTPTQERTASLESESQKRDCSCDCIIKLVELLLAAQSKEPTLIRAELLTLTGDAGNKDQDTAIFLSVKTSDGRMELASVTNADASGKDMTTYNDDSYHIIPLVLEAPGAVKSQCGQFRVKLFIKTHGNNEWPLDLIRVILYFGDGTNLVAQGIPGVLNGDGAHTEFSAP